jgi:hypothetical protein
VEWNHRSRALFATIGMLQVAPLAPRASLLAFEQVLEGVRDLLLKPECGHLEFCLLLRSACQRLESLGTHVRTQFGTLTRRMPSVLLLSILHFLSPSEKLQTLFVCQSWHALSALTAPQIRPCSPHATPPCEAALHQGGGSPDDEWILCGTCGKVVCQVCSTEEHKVHVFWSIERGVDVVKGFLQEADARSSKQVVETKKLVQQENGSRKALIQRANEKRKVIEDLIQKRVRNLERAAMMTFLTRFERDPLRFLQ